MDGSSLSEGMVWKYRTGAPWRDVPERFGKWNLVYKRFNRWAADGTWEQLLAEVYKLADATGEVDWVASIDSTIARVHQQGRIPHGGGWRVHGRGSAQDRAAGVKRDRAARQGASGSRGFRFLHHAVDDHSRLAYSEIHDDERKGTAASFWVRANAFFAAAGIHVEAVMTDNGSCYRSREFATALGDAKHRFTKPYRPQTNGKVERFNRTLASEWAYARPYASDAARTATYADWLHHYNHHRPHTGLGGQTPSDRVHNLTGNYT